MPPEDGNQLGTRAYLRILAHFLGGGEPQGRHTLHIIPVHEKESPHLQGTSHEHVKCRKGVQGAHSTVATSEDSEASQLPGKT